MKDKSQEIEVKELADDIEKMFPWIPTNVKNMLADFAISWIKDRKQTPVATCEHCHGTGVTENSKDQEIECIHCDGKGKELAPDTCQSKEWPLKHLGDPNDEFVMGANAMHDKFMKIINGGKE